MLFKLNLRGVFLAVELRKVFASLIRALQVEALVYIRILVVFILASATRLKTAVFRARQEVAHQYFAQMAELRIACKTIFGIYDGLIAANTGVIYTLFRRQLHEDPCRGIFEIEQIWVSKADL